MSKRKEQKKRFQSALAPLALLRPRLDGLLGNDLLARADAQRLKADLNAVCKGLKPSDLLPILLRACAAAPAPVQARLDEVAPDWLNEQGYTDSLLALLNRDAIAPSDRPRAQSWLQAAGVAVPAVCEIKKSSDFYRAYSYSDGSQGIITTFWYSDARQQKVRGMSFLIDFNPPWEGAVKDIMVIPRRSPDQAIQEFVDSWAHRGMPLSSLSGAEVKLEILKGLASNRSENIRLPRDLIHARDLFLKHVLSLPDTPDTPLFTAEDFDALARTGETPESIRHFERTVGRRVRLESGEEILVMGADDEEW